MTQPSDPLLVETIWRAADLTRAYLAQDRARVAACLVGLDSGLLDRVHDWLILDHDQLFQQLGEPTMTVSRLKATAALAPAEIEFATSTAIHRVAAGETGLALALESLGQLDRIHALTVCMAVMLLDAYGRGGALAEIDEMTAGYEERGFLRPYPAV
ncbi:hypothetical protein [Streptomyces sp. PsTaAH-124]|uniref:hypothetical protein n=1 Tax=Streptomyces sp. PsTaAH-124 TaxID=1157638 RepID=UPI000375BC09|nr:hypothetical protein [Streptomyces sp. PsTaAH-124]